MKKLFSLMMAAVLAAALAAGCGATTPAPTPSAPPAPTPTPSAPSVSTPSAPPAGSGAVKTGLAVITNIANSKNAAASEDGVVQGYSTIAAVTVDGAGKIVACVIDAAQTNVGLSADGVITTALDTQFSTKNELGDAYGMKSASTIGREWNEQAAAFAAYVVGKTAAEVQGIAVTGDGHAADSDLTASVTVHVTDFINVVAQAVNSAKELGAAASDKLGVGTVTNIANSKNAAADAEGFVQIYSTYAAVTTGGDGKITSCVIDASQANVNFGADGVISTPLDTAFQTKNEIGDAYGMKSASKIGKEWYEQAAAFAAYATGKTAAEVAGIAVEAGLAAESDLTASVTIHVTDFMSAIAKAVK